MNDQSPSRDRRTAEQRSPGDSTRGGGKSGGRRHAARAGSARDDSASRSNAPSRPGFREERLEKRHAEPDLPEGLDTRNLDPLIRQDLRVLSKDNAEGVAQHILMAMDLVNDEPKLALAHARAVKNRAGRVGIARELNGVVAYHAGEWKEALAELRAARRISGGPGLLVLMADCERGLGRPEKAVEIGRSPEARDLDGDSRIELAIVVAGARLDLGQNESALVTLERMQPSLESTSLVSARLSYAYADALIANGRASEARPWFEHAATVDVDATTDAAERLAELN